MLLSSSHLPSKKVKSDNLSFENQTTHKTTTPPWPTEMISNVNKNVTEEDMIDSEIRRAHRNSFHNDSASISVGTVPRSKYIASFNTTTSHVIPDPSTTLTNNTTKETTFIPTNVYQEQDQIENYYTEKLHPTSTSPKTDDSADSHWLLEPASYGDKPLPYKDKMDRTSMSSLGSTTQTHGSSSSSTTRLRQRFQRFFSQINPTSISPSRNKEPHSSFISDSVIPSTPYPSYHYYNSRFSKSSSTIKSSADTNLNFEFEQSHLSPPDEVCSHRVVTSWNPNAYRILSPERYVMSMSSANMKNFHETTVPIFLHSIHHSNLSDLRHVNENVIPVRYQDQFYHDVVDIHRPEFSRLAYVNSNPVGAIACRKEAIGDSVPATEFRVYIMTLGVISSYRRFRIGSILLERIIRYCETDSSLVYLGLHVQTTNIKAIRFYMKHGFYIYCKINGYYYRNQNVQPPDAYFLKRDLRRHTGCLENLQANNRKIPVYTLTSSPALNIS